MSPTLGAYTQRLALLVHYCSYWYGSSGTSIYTSTSNVNPMTTLCIAFKERGPTRTLMQVINPTAQEHDLATSAAPAHASGRTVLAGQGVPSKPLLPSACGLDVDGIAHASLRALNVSFTRLQFAVRTAVDQTIRLRKYARTCVCVGKLTRRFPDRCLLERGSAVTPDWTKNTRFRWVTPTSGVLKQGAAGCKLITSSPPAANLDERLHLRRTHRR